MDDVSRPPLNTIQDPNHHDGGVSDRSKAEKKTPLPASAKCGYGNMTTDATTFLPRDKDRNNGFAATDPFRLGQKSESGGVVNGELNDEEGRTEFNDPLVQSSRGVSGNGGFPMMTPPRSVRMAGRANDSSSCYYSENNSTQNTLTPTKSTKRVSKPRGKVDGNGGSGGGGGALGSIISKGVPITFCPSLFEVPHFDLKEDASPFWMEHNVQVLIRIRPLSSMEKSIHGFNRCLKQESAETVSWVGQPETRFTFDNVACETVDQEMLFRVAGLPMVENCLSGYNSCIFAYGQTGSGKTYTMLGEIDNVDVRPSSNRGMMPRIFEFLFARIRAEEEIRRDERLQYNCKCSFLEIYNEQITDLLDPSSSNLLVREDMTKGVYVENVSEFEVQTVGDILKLVLQGSLNRKVAATNMNKESSRSHSVFTCVIESRWEKNSTNNLRFSRLNLVDLAGSERQKTSGAEGERLKEAANINKSLSTLGHVIMVLLDVAQGKPKHIPYRDSRLTYLLQDSLGGNSKTMIIANVSPSIGCAAETLNTLKFAQRAKFIQNNAVVNEDSSGDVTTLQRRICLLKEELSILKRRNISRSLSFGQPISEDISLMLEDEQNDDYLVGSESRGIVRISSKQWKSLEATLAGALRREQMAETSIKQLEAEIEQLKRLVHQREEDTRCTKMTPRFREDKINRLESLLGGSIPADTYLLLDDTALTKENEVLRTKEVHVINARDSLQFELDETLGELAECRSKLSTCLEVNEQLTREMHDLRSLMNNPTTAPIDQNNDVNIIKDSLESPALAPHLPKAVQYKTMEEKLESLTNHMDEIVNLQLELDILKEEQSSRSEAEEKVRSLNKDLDQEIKKVHPMRKECEDLKHELEDAKSIIEALESQQIIIINKMEDLKNISGRNEELLSEKELELRVLKEQMFNLQLRDQSPLQAKLKKMQDSLETAKKLNMLYQTDRAFQTSNEEQMDEIGRQAEAETAEVIVCLQEELSILEEEVQASNLKEMEARKQVICLQTHLKELEEQICLLTQKLEDKDLELTTVSQGWEILTSEIEVLLADGHEEILDASVQLDLIADSFLEKRSWVSGEFGKMIRLISEKEELIRELRRYLDDSNKRIAEVESMLRSLRGAALAITEAYQQELTVMDRTISRTTGQLSEGKSIVENLENKIKRGEDQLRKVSACATAAFVMVNRLHETNLNKSDVIKHTDGLVSESTEMNQQKNSRLHDQVTEVEEAERQIQLPRKELQVSEESCCSLRPMLTEEQMKNQLKVLNVSICNTTKCLNSVESLDRLSSNISNKQANITIVDKLFQEFRDNSELTFKFIEDLDFLGNIAKDMSSKNSSLQTELHRKDDIIKGLLFDLSLLQESAANSKNQKDEIKETMASLEALKNELLVKSDELVEAVSFGHTLERQLKEKIGIISTLGLELSQQRESVKFLSNENIELRTCIEDLSAEKTSIEDNLTEKMNTINGLEQELVQFRNAFCEMNASVDTLKKNVSELTYERSQLQMDMLHLKGKLDMAEADAEANEAIAVEAQQLAESSKLYAGEKEEEVKLLEKSVEELENTVDVLENKVDIVKGEAECQRLQREELELELHAVRYQLQNVECCDDDMQRHLDEKKIELREALKRVQILEIDITDREAEISKLKSHISELNLHAEAQACEYKQKFKALEGMVEQVKLDRCLNNVTNSSSDKPEKNASKPRGSGSPFKCIGLGLVQQRKSEKDEELSVAKTRIEELEALAVSRQKEIFMLNSRLASAESMTHDVLRDLLEVKLDMTKYASFLDNDEMHKISKNARVPCTESQVKEKEISRLKQQLGEFIEERAGWVEEIDRKHAELVTAQIALDKLRQQVQFLKVENETFKMESVDHRKNVMDLEGEMKKLSGQQNFQRRIHHHAKIKEENNQLRIQNENLSNKVRRLDGTHSRVK